ncbi:MAG TPA: hypothetical protein VFD38_16885 [Myxococcaceae bacterium]|nr:hypothetical protein [Myxococcaceae bacterium]
MHRSSHPVQVATEAPLLRVVLLLLLLVAALAGVLVASSAEVGWLALGVVVVVGPVAVMVEGRSRNRSDSEPAAALRAPAQPALGAWRPAVPRASAPTPAPTVPSRGIESGEGRAAG